MDKKFSSQRYFLYNISRVIHNKNKILSKKYRPSISEVLNDYVEIFNDFKENAYNSKLEKSLSEYLSVLKFNIQNFPLNKNKLFKADFETLIMLIDDKENADFNRRKAFIVCCSLLKKIKNINIYQIIIEEAKKENTFSTVDDLSFLLVSELILEGYSLEFLKKWIITNIHLKTLTEENIENEINKLNGLKKEKKEHIYFINLYKYEHKFENNNIFFEGQLENFIKIEKTVLSEIKSVDEYSFLQNSNDYELYTIKIKVMDMFKGIEIIKSTLIEYFELIKFVNNIEKTIYLDKILVKDSEENYQKLNMNEDYDRKILFLESESREKQDIKDFIEYRNNAFLDKNYYSDLVSLQRALNIIRVQHDQTRENRLINLWSVIEYILTYNEGNSIIGKVKDIIPKLICLYFIKEKVNGLWHEVYLIYSKNNTFDIINEIYDNCKKDNIANEYDLKKFLNYIEKNGKTLIKKLETFDIIKREMAFIGEFITKQETRAKEIKNLYSEIENDIIRIYRTRNIIVHSGYNTNTNIDLKSLRLYKYSNHLLGVLIYFKNKNNELTIQEILNSIKFTFENYEKIIKEDKPDLYILCKPPYLFL